MSLQIKNAESRTGKASERLNTFFCSCARRLCTPGRTAPRPSLRDVLELEACGSSRFMFGTTHALGRDRQAGHGQGEMESDFYLGASTAILKHQTPLLH